MSAFPDSFHIVGFWRRTVWNVKNIHERIGRDQFCLYISYLSYISLMWYLLSHISYVISRIYHSRLLTANSLEFDKYSWKDCPDQFCLYISYLSYISLMWYLLSHISYVISRIYHSRLLAANSLEFDKYSWKDCLRLISYLISLIYISNVISHISYIM